jgi:PAS domain S-box-containing protein
MDDGSTREVSDAHDADWYQTLVEGVNDIVTVVDPDGTITYVSPAVTRVLGYDPDELVGHEGYEFVHPDDQARTAEAMEAVVSNDSAPRTLEVRFRHDDGSYRWLEATLRNRLDDAVVEGILFSTRDITERKSAEADVRELADESDTLLNTVDDAIFLVDVTRREGDVAFEFERLSPSYERQTGITTEEVRGETPRAVFGQEAGARVEANYRRCVEAGEPRSYQEELPVADGARFWQTKLAPVVTDGVVTRLVGITRNVTDRVERERRLRRQNERLDEFASVISHDLRNPLAVAQGRATFLAEESAADREHLDPLLRALDRIESIVEDTLTLARQGDAISETTSIRLTTLARRCWATVDTGDATLETPDEVTFRGDPDRLRHVFENLFRNAVEHGDAPVTVRVGRLADRGIYVEDDGPGIPAADREVVFEAGHSSAPGGTGFGLAIAQRIVSAHGWEMAVTDGTDGGARFEIEFADRPE